MKSVSAISSSNLPKFDFSDFSYKFNKPNFYVLEINMKKKLAEERKHMEKMKREAYRKKLQKLLDTDVEDLDELEKMKGDMVDQHFQKMKEDKAEYEQNIDSQPDVLNDPNLANKGILTDINQAKVKGTNSDLRADGSYGGFQDSLDSQKEMKDYLYGPKAFEALDMLTEEQIKEFLPLTNLESDDEEDPEWVRDYKRFLRQNELNLKHMRQIKGKYDLTKDIHESKKQKWLMRQKFKIVNKLRKHEKMQSEARVNNTIQIEDHGSQR